VGVRHPSFHPDSAPHLYNPALCGPLVDRSRLRVNVKRDATIRVSQKLLYRLHIFSVRPQDRAEGMTEGVPDDVLVDADLDVDR
jgi:hypothetical protein